MTRQLVHHRDADYDTRLIVKLVVWKRTNIKQQSSQMIKTARK